MQPAEVEIRQRMAQLRTTLRRRPAQIAACMNDDEECIFALADDGTIWRYPLGGDEQRAWRRLPDLPQD